MEQHLGTDRAATTPFAGDRLNHIGPSLSQQRRRCDGVRERLKDGRRHGVKGANHKAPPLDWVMVAIWLFIGVIILVSVLAAYQMGAKLSFRSP